jgi:hypothetical protein
MAGRKPKPGRKKSPRGNDLALALPTPDGMPLVLSYWDLWFALAAVNDHGGDLERMTSAFRQTSYDSLADRMTWDHYMARERYRNHLIDLKRRLEGASATPSQVVAAAGDLAKGFPRWLSSAKEDERSIPMRDSPRKRRYEHALRGFWPGFPVSPEPYAEEIGSKFKIKRFFSRDAALGVAQTLDHHVDHSDALAKSGKSAEAQALLRGLVTVVLEQLQPTALWGDRVLKASLREAFAAYLRISPDRTGIDETVFFPDLLNFLIWHGDSPTWVITMMGGSLTDLRAEGYFKGLDEDEGELCITHLRHEFAGLSEDILDDRMERTLNLLGQVVAELERFDTFEDVARQMGAEHADRIVRLVDRAMKRRKRSLACKVFEAALAGGVGWSASDLEKEYEKLKRGDWTPGRPEAGEDAEDAD